MKTNSLTPPRLFEGENFERDLKLVYYTAFIAWFITVVSSLLRYFPFQYFPVRFLMDQLSVIPFGIMMGIFIYRYFWGTKVALFGSLALASMLMTFLINFNSIYDFLRGLINGANRGYMQRVFVDTFLTTTTYFLVLTVLKLSMYLVKTRREAEKLVSQLVQNESRLAEAQGVAKLGYWEWDIEPDHLYLSEEARNLCQLSKGNPLKVVELIKRIESNDRIIFNHYIEAVLAGEKPLDPEIQYRLQDGTLRDFHVMVYLSCDESGVPERLFGTIQDITRRVQMEKERQKLEEQLVQSRKIESLGVLSGGIAHDFNNLLVGILSRASLVQSGMDTDSEDYNHLNNIIIASERAAELCDQMLAFSGKGTLESEPLDLNDLLLEIDQLLKKNVSELAKFEFDLDHSIPLINADATQIRQLAMNLILNASDSLEEMPGQIRISSGLMNANDEYLNHACFNESLVEGEYVYIEVTDTGCGMNSEMVNKIFEPFYSTKFTGRGLGLAATVGIVRGHGGAIFVDSKVGAGSRFRILFPVSEDKLLPKTREMIRVRPDEVDGTILVADDEEIVRNVTRQVLVKAGYEVELAEDGEKAIELCLENPERFTAIIIDKTMPGLNGEQTLKELRKIKVQSPIMLTSGYDVDSSRESYESQGFACFVKKPYRPRLLLEKLDQSIRKSRKIKAKSR